MTKATESLIIRRAERRDLPVVVALLADDQLGSTRERALEPLPDTYLRAFEAMERQADNELWVAELDGEIVGCLQFTIIASLSRQGSARAQIEGVRVARESRGKRVGERMMQAAIEAARTRRCRLVQLTTDRRREDAHRFYERLGFKATHVGMKLTLDD